MDAAWLALGVTLCLAVLGALWRLATMLAEVRSEVRHNGGGSLKDKIATLIVKVDGLKESTEANWNAVNRLDNRMTDHRRRNEEAVERLREHIEARMAARRASGDER